MNPNTYTFYRTYRNEEIVFFFRLDIAVDIATAPGWTAGVRFPAEARNFSLLHSVQTGSGAHPASCLTDTWVSFLIFYPSDQLILSSFVPN
jgi:hypothetical protein